MAKIKAWLFEDVCGFRGTSQRNDLWARWKHPGCLGFRLKSVSVVSKVCVERAECGRSQVEED